MTFDPVHNDETVEDLQLAGLKLIQKKNGFRFGMDSVLLADFAAVKTTDTVADFGCGNCILPLLLIGRNKGNAFFAIDIQEDAASTARRTVMLNHLEDRITVICDDVKKADSHIRRGSVDCVVCNPPYTLSGQGIVNPSKEKATARHQSEAALDSFLKTAFILLKGKGKISLCYPASQMLQIMVKLHEHHLEPKRFRLVYPFADKPANLVLIEAVKDAKPLLHTMPPLIAYQKEGTLTNELKSIYHIEEQTKVQER